MPSVSYRIISLCLVLFAWPTATGLAYNPPVDTAGPLTVRIEGPAEVDKTGTPVEVCVVVENQGEAAVEGTVRLGVIDHWRVEPEGDVPFSAPAKETVRCRFRATAGQGTFSAHYPIHASAEFEHEGQKLVAHPILILETTLPPRPRPAPGIAWEPVEIAADTRLALERLTIRRAVIQEFGKDAETMPAGWEGSHAKNHGSSHVAACSLDHSRRYAIQMHPPWHGGRVGTVLTEFPLALPDSRPIRLDFAHGVTATGSGDGVTFRVRVAAIDAADGAFGEVVFERHSAAKTWQPVQVDLSRFAGQTIRLQLESHPGPDKNTGWDASFWAEPTLTAGSPAEPPPMPPADEAESQLLGSVATDGTTRSATDGTSAPWKIRVWPGPRGLLDAVVGFSRGEQRLYFRGFRVQVSGLRLDEPGSPSRLLNVSAESCEQGIQIRHRFEGHRGQFDLVGRMWVEPGGLKARFQLENTPPPKPWEAFWIEDAAVDAWSQPVKQVYAGHGNVVRAPKTYSLRFDGHRLATSFVGFDFEPGLSLVQAVDLPPVALEVEPDEDHCSLHVPQEGTFCFIPAENVWNAVRTYRDTNGLKPASGVAKAAGRFVFDLWGGRYADSRQALERSFAYGLTDAMVVWHNWQRWGYDYRLPEIYPANPRWGTHEEFVELCAACKRAGVIFAPHDNYIDYYPDAEGFSYEKQIAFHADGRPVKAWLNRGRDARSYRYRADAIETPLVENVRRIRQGVAPTGYFIDVWSSARPYDYWTADGQFVDCVTTRDTWARHFAWIRQTLGNDAPQISESGHDQLIGFLDGAQTNHLRVGNQIPAGRYTGCALAWDCADAERTPWFDVAHHNRFVLHGAGYESRYCAGLNRRLHGMYSDDYLATEVLTGHPGMVKSAFGRDVVRKYWLVGPLMRALALRTIERVEYTESATAAPQSAVGKTDGNLHRQHVVWSGGAQVWVNRGETDWPVGDVLLPPFGFLARVPTDKGLVEASITRRQGIIVERAASPGILYVNGRKLVDGPRRLSLAVGKASLDKGRRVTLPLCWQLDDPVPQGYQPFLHFCDQAGEILFQASHDRSKLTGGRTGKVELTASASLPGGLQADAEYELRMGFYRPNNGGRLALIGPDDGEKRIVVGTLRVQADANGPAAVEFVGSPAQPDPFLKRWNPQQTPVDFGPVTTVGACRLSPEGDALMITPLPNDGQDAIETCLDWAKLPWKLPEPTHVEVIDESGKAIGREPIHREGGQIVLSCQPGVFAYRLGGEK